VRRKLSTYTLSQWFTLILALLFAVPVLAVVLHLFEPASDNWQHLSSTVLPQYIANSLYLMVGVGLVTLFIGALTAWLVVMYDFPGRGIFEWALILPLAVPAYVMAYAYTDFFQFSGPFQTFVRGVMDWGARDWRLANIRSSGGAVVVFSAALYPYVYLIARAAFMQQSGGILEAARTLGSSGRDLFLRVGFPAARPALAAGVALVLMETLADFGTVSFFGVPTFTTGIYRTWFSLGDQVAAAQLATMLLGFVMLLLALERWSRGKRRFDSGRSTHRDQARVKLRGGRGLLAMTACALPLLLGFVLPATVLALMAARLEGTVLDGRFFELVLNTVGLGGIAALLAIMFGLTVVFALRQFAGRSGGVLIRLAARIAGVGYAIPGSIIAVGVLIPFAAMDRGLNSFMQAQFGLSTGLFLTGGIVALIFAYLVRFLSVSMQTLEAGYARIRPNMDGAAYSLGAGAGRVLREIHLPLLRGSILTAFLMVFVDVMKELPATLIMRPFNFDTLAVTAHNYAADERLAEAAIPALSIVIVGLLPVLILSRMISAGGSRGAEVGDQHVNSLATEENSI